MKVIREKIDPTQLEMGRRVEQEHLPTYERLKAYLLANGELPSMDWFADSIAHDHLDPDNPVEAGKPDYYTVLKDAGL